MLYKRCSCTEPARCRHPFSYQFMVNGVLYRRSTRTANKQSAGRLEDRRRVAILENRDDAPKHQITLKAHIADYTAHTAKTNATAYKDADVLARFVVSAGEQPLKTVSPFLIEKWKRDRAGAVSRSTVNRELNIVRGCFSRAVDWQRLVVSPVASVKAYDVDDRRIRVFSDDELRCVLTGAAPWAVLVCRVTLECLPRLSEVINIERSHIGPTWIEVRRKGGKVDRLAVNPDLRASLLAMPGEYLFGDGGKPPSEQTASLRIRRMLKRLGILNASHHTFRHTGVTLMLENGVNPRVIQKLAGWSSLRMLERYGHVRDAELVRAVTGNAAYLEHLRGKPLHEPLSTKSITQTG